MDIIQYMDNNDIYIYTIVTIYMPYLSAFSGKNTSQIPSIEKPSIFYEKTNIKYDFNKLTSLVPVSSISRLKTGNGFHRHIKGIGFSRKHLTNSSYKLRRFFLSRIKKLVWSKNH